ncbi:hypothetical protein [Candidatus Uabimicrobium amorphum]|uniref:Uncharacterized protein n=1 Tax=Uabimicrobium amorphum TaxID=2596890 RepID=A0A5S9IMI5_UABAM|nr:hypothetical protein [Candidatus Uabimicrobium amorphum]BBM84444.1 hypothetical protein UABAM_02804 [Candidatus Uabimicrobium amorphum]
MYGLQEDTTNVPLMQIEDEEEKFQELQNAIDSCDGYTDAEWEIKKFHPETNGWRRVARIPITESNSTEDLKEKIKMQKWGGAGTYSITLYNNDQTVARASKIKFYIDDIDKEATNTLVDHYKIPTANNQKQDAFQKELHEIQVENLRSMRYQKMKHNLKKEMNEDEPQQPQGGDQLSTMMQMQFNMQQLMLQQQQRQDEIKREDDKRREEQRLRDEQSRQEREARQEEIRLKMIELQMNQQQQNQQMLLQLMHRENPIEKLLLEKTLQDKKDPIMDSIPQFLSMVTGTQQKMQEAGFEILKKNLEKNNILTESEESIRKIAAIREEIIGPAIQALQAWKSSAQQTQYTTTTTKPETRPQVQTQTQTPTQQPEMTSAEKAVREAGTMIMNGKTGEEVWNFILRKLSNEELHELFTSEHTKQQINEALSSLANAGYSAANFILKQAQQNFSE